MGAERRRQIYRLRRKPSGPGKAFVSYDLTVPTEIGDALREADISLFLVELTEEGILYRPVKAAMSVEMERPSWLK